MHFTSLLRLVWASTVLLPTVTVSCRAPHPAADAPAAERAPVADQVAREAGDAREENKRIARRVFDEILTGGRYGAARELYAPDFVNHGLHHDVDLATDQAAAKGWRDAMPDLTMSVERIVAERDTVAVLWSGRGTHTGSFAGLPPTGHHIEGRGITVWRMEGGRIKEEWSEFDQAGLMKQLGVPEGP